MENQTAAKKILIVDDESDILELLHYNISKQGYEVSTANCGGDAITIASKETPDMIILDIMMPGLDGIETCRKLKSITSLKDTYIIFLTARNEEYSEVAGFDVGADDYITKPIKPRALISRINAFFRREESRIEKIPIITISDLIIDKTKYTVRKDNIDISLPKKEFELIYYLAKYPNKIHSREDLLAKIWGTDVYVIDRTVDVHIRKIREKVKGDYIKTVKGVGYMFNAQ